MALAEIKLEGTAQIGISEIICVCGHCGKHDRAGGTIELNFKEQRVIYVCSECKKSNKMEFGKTMTPLPRSRVM